MSVPLKQKKRDKTAVNLDAMAIAGLTASDLKALMISLDRMPADGGDEALDRAQEKIFDAWDAPTAEARVAMAHEALALSPLCADAYLILAKEAVDAGEALALHERAVAAGAEALGEAAFTDDVGMFWGLIETRPYMRARHELALMLWDTGRRDDAIEHYNELLRLNPNDNQGIRYLLLDALIELGREREAAALLKRYKEDGSAAWAWSRTLLAFRKTGNGATSRRALAKATEVNRHVATYLVGKKRLPKILPDFIGMGDVDEAVAYLHGAAGAWAVTPEARVWVSDWLAANVKTPKPKRSSRL